MDPKLNRAPESEEPENVDDSDVEMIEEEASDRDTIPPGGLLTTESIPPGDPEIEDALFDEELGNVFSRLQVPTIPPLPATPVEEDDEEDAFYKQFEKSD